MGWSSGQITINFDNNDNCIINNIDLDPNKTYNIIINDKSDKQLSLTFTSNNSENKSQSVTTQYLITFDGCIMKEITAQIGEPFKVKNILYTSNQKFSDNLNFHDLSVYKNI